MDSIRSHEQYEVVRQWIHIAQNRKMKYCVTRSKIFSEDLGWYTTFGMEIMDCSTNECSRVEDISPNGEAVLRFANLCSDLEVGPEHLLDTAENFLALLYGYPSEKKVSPDADFS